MRQAESQIYNSEVVIVYDSEACLNSENARWEVKRAREIDKPVVELSRSDIDSGNVGALRSIYDFSSEFEGCFSFENTKDGEVFDLYKIMIESSEQLIQRRQITNGFFITLIGAIVAGCGFLIKEKVVSDAGIIVLIFPMMIGILLCRSWGNLIENYGKLNAGKFKVIHRLEKQMSARVFDAEWVALGKGLRREKYQSFTTTERNVPSLFLVLMLSMLAFILLSVNWKELFTRGADIFLGLKVLLGQAWDTLSAVGSILSHFSS